jgi:hypothetical protein
MIPGRRVPDRRVDGGTERRNPPSVKGPGVGDPTAELHPLIVHEWRHHHRLSPRSLAWIAEHAEAHDPYPIASVIATLMTEAQLPS